MYLDQFFFINKTFYFCNKTQLFTMAGWIVTSSTTTGLNVTDEG